MKIYQVRELPPQELEKRIKDEEENLVHLKFQKATSQLENPLKIRNARRDIARMKTVLRERQAQSAAKTGKKT
ncbi:MAG: 50S ribosomal protein L29 [Ignavibacteria bacterium 13_1_40CM_2_61_4]|nr:MAG: 50S ribosomal protein L29 [Ignavibacteria bacterium 13_1_40CM_2_61_4]